MYRLLLLLLLPLSMLAQNKYPVDKRLAALDTAFERALKLWQAPGFAVAVVEKNRIIYAKGFGFRDQAKKLPVTPQTVFAIGSCTKAFTTSLIGILQKEGKLDIDKPAHDYLETLNFFTPELTNQVTLRDMMSHRTGLPRHDFSWYLFPSSNRDSLVRRIQYQEPTFPIRRQWQYNNFMFIAQGAITEKLTGKSWEANIRERILQPLGMKNTSLSWDPNPSTPEVALGYGIKKDSIVYGLPYYNISAAGPAGSINSSVIDMSNWVITWINGGKYNGKEVLPDNFVRDAMSSQMVIAPGLPTKEKPDIQFSNYGFGWFLGSYKGHYRVEHGGNIDGFSASTSFFPTDSIGIIVLVNQDRSSIPSIVRNIIADRLFGKPYHNWSDELYNNFTKANTANRKAALSADSARKSDTKPSHSLSSFEGLYSHPGYGTLDVYAKGDSLIGYTTLGAIYLKHFHYDIFQPYMQENGAYDVSEPVQVHFRFNTGTNGDIESLTMFGVEAPDIDLTLKRNDRPKPVSKEELQSYVGTYSIAGGDVKFYVKDNLLFLSVPGQPDYELVPTGKDKFSFKNVSGFAVQFLRTGDKLTAVNIIQPNGTFKAERKE